MDFEERYLNARADLQHARMLLEQAEEQLNKSGAHHWQRAIEERRAEVEKFEALVMHVAAQREAAFGGI